MAEWDGLENRYTRKCIEGSNPSLSANQNHGPEGGPFHFWAAKACFRKP